MDMLKIILDSWNCDETEVQDTYHQKIDLG